MNFTINAIQHIGVPVTDIERSQAFYERLGFTNVMGKPFDYQGGKGQVVMMKSADMIIELYQMPEKELIEIGNRSDGHVDHIAFDVDDIDLVFKELRDASFPILEEQPVFLPFWEKGCRYFNITGPDGERLEFNQIL
jgi:catechol 2,3-dioxygenase-like lactoylglutathione lyase family enzyme